MQLLSFLMLSTVVAVGFAAAETEDDELLTELKEVLERGLKNKFKGFAKNRKNRVSRQLACPVPQTVLVQTGREEKRCRRDRGCGVGERCCDWFNKKHCLKGIKKTHRPGTCPKITQFNDACIADHVSCRYDEECPGEGNKCCMNPGCGYKECLSPRQNIACPVPKSFVPVPRSEKTCGKDTECGLDEKCCSWDGSNHCLKGINTIPTPGLCPASVKSPHPACIADLPSCNYDGECGGVNMKCCHHADCDYRECVDMNRDYTCPSLSPELSQESAASPTRSSACSPNVTSCEGFGKLCCATEVGNAGDLVYECVEGDYNPPTQGQCPDPSSLPDPFGECLEDFEGGCEVDNHCWTTHKCCETSCGYKECYKPDENESLLKRFMDTLKQMS